MFIAAELIPSWLSLGSWMVLLVTCGLAARFADWQALWRVSTRHHLLFGSIALLFFFRVLLHDVLKVW